MQLEHRSAIGQESSRLSRLTGCNKDCPLYALICSQKRNAVSPWNAIARVAFLSEIGLVCMKLEQLPTDFIAASHVARLAIQLANIGHSTPEQELRRAWRLIEVARGMVREHAAFRPVTTEPPKVAEKLEAEFVSLPGPGKRCAMSGLSRSSLYQLAALGKIRMISLRREGNSRGKRLVAVESLRHYLRTLDAQQNQSAPDRRLVALIRGTTGRE